MQLNPVLLLILLFPLACFVLGGNDGACRARNDKIIEDEILLDSDKISFDPMMNEVSQEKIDEEPSSYHSKCVAGRIPEMSQFGVPSIAGIPGLPNIDPNMFVNVLINVMEVLEDKVRELMIISELGMCPQIKPVDIFLMKNPYVNYEKIISKDDGLDALNKMKALRDEVKLKIPEI